MLSREGSRRAGRISWFCFVEAEEAYLQTLESLGGLRDEDLSCAEGKMNVASFQE